MVQRPLPIPKLSRRVRIMIFIAAGVVLLLSLFAASVSYYVDWLWFGETGYRTVFTTQLRTRVLLFFLFGLFMALVIGVNMWLAYRARPPFRPMSTEQQNLERYRSAIEPRRRLVFIGSVVLVGIFAGISAQSKWQVWQLWRNGQHFGIQDPQFHKDISFFAFTYPFARMVLGVLFAAAVLSLLAAVVVHYLYGALRIQTPGPKLTVAARVHLSVLLGVLVLLKAVAYYLDRYGLVFSERGQVTGASYTDVNAALPAKTILMVIAVLCAVAFFANIFFRNFQLPAISLVLLILSSVLIGGAYPALIQQFKVKPNADQTERTYIARNIESTRQAYGITKDQVKQADYAPAGQVSEDTKNAIRNDKDSIPNARLLDPNVLSPSFDVEQRVRNIYGFADKLDIDRYTIDGKTQDYVLGVREMDSGSLTGNQTNWINRHLVYTHGFGIAAAPANQITNDGKPVFSFKDIPATGNLTINEPRIYYGERFNDAYSIVGNTGNNNREFDQPGDNGKDITSTYAGKGGVNIGNTFNRLAFAMKYREQRILFSGAIKDNSKILYVRDPRERVEKAAPFLKADGDPYPVVVDGRIKWIVDGYTTLKNYPYSEKTTLGDVTQDATTGRGTASQPKEEVNYIRNSVKATVDAYDGTVTLYQFGKRDPVLETWKKVFPKTIKPESEISPQLREHFRYPEDMFKVQRDMLAKYHVDDPVQFFNSQGFWETPQDPNRPENQPPFYLNAKIPGQENTTFQLTSTMNSLRRPNLAAYISASSDPKDYGTIRVLNLPSNSTVAGVRQAQSQFSSDPTIARDLSLLDQQQSRVIFGNLLTLPVGNGLLYIEPMYVQAEGSAFPLFRRVLASFGDKVAYEDTLAKALDSLFGSGAGQQAPDQGVTPTPGPTSPPSPPSTPPTPPTNGQPPAGASPELAKAVTDIQHALENLQNATKAGDFAKIGQAQADLAKATADFDKAQKAQPAPSPSPSPSNPPPNSSGG